MAFDSDQFRRVLGHFPTGVTVVTGIVDGEPVGFTVGSFSSVSLDPPLVAFMAMLESERWQQLRKADAFCVNVLGHEGGALCWQFAKSSIEHPFEGVAWHPSELTGAPVLEDSIATIDCTFEAVYDAGDHHIVLGRVVGLDHIDETAEPLPLVFYRGRLGRFHAHDA